MLRVDLGSSQSVALAATGLPSGATVDLDPVTVTPESPDNFDLMSVKTLRTTPPGTYSLKITGRANGISKSRTVTLIVTP